MDSKFGVKNKLPIEYLWFAVTRVFAGVFILYLLSDVNVFFGSLFPLSILVGVIYVILIIINYFTTSYLLDKGQLTIFSGLIIKRSSTVAFNNVQNIEIKSGVIARIFGLTKISIWTASLSQIEIYKGKSDTKPSQFLYLKNSDAEGLKKIMLTPKDS